MEKNTDTFQHDYSKKHLNMISSQGNQLLEESSLAQPGKTKKVSRWYLNGILWYIKYFWGKINVGQ